MVALICFVVASFMVAAIYATYLLSIATHAEDQSMRMSVLACILVALSLFIGHCAIAVVAYWAHTAVTDSADQPVYEKRGTKCQKN